MWNVHILSFSCLELLERKILHFVSELIISCLLGFTLCLHEFTCDYLSDLLCFTFWPSLCLLFLRIGASLIAYFLSEFFPPDCKPFLGLYIGSKTDFINQTEGPNWSCVKKSCLVKYWKLSKSFHHLHCNLNNCPLLFIHFLFFRSTRKKSSGAPQEDGYSLWWLWQFWVFHHYL